MSAPLDRRARATELLKKLGGAADSIDDYLAANRPSARRPKDRDNAPSEPEPSTAAIPEQMSSLPEAGGQANSSVDMAPGLSSDHVSISGNTDDGIALSTGSVLESVNGMDQGGSECVPGSQSNKDQEPGQDELVPEVESDIAQEESEKGAAPITLTPIGQDEVSVLDQTASSNPPSPEEKHGGPLEGHEDHPASGRDQDEDDGADASPISTSVPFFVDPLNEIAPGASPAPVTVQEEVGPVDEIDQELLPIVVEEIEELTPQVETLLRNLMQGDKSALPDLHRYVHTIKGSLGLVGAMRLRTVAHSMESLLDDALGGDVDADMLDRVLSLFEGLKERMEVVLFGRGPEPVRNTGQDEVAPVTVRAAPRLVRVQAQEIDRMVAENNEARLAGAGIKADLGRLRAMLAELLENGQRLARVQRDLEIQAESQIQSRRAQLAESGQEFDPLEMDRFTRLQETSRFLSEGVSDASDIHRELSRHMASIETLMVEQESSISQVGDGLARTRLVPVDTINDRLYQVVWRAARELDKKVEFRLVASSGQMLDRMILDNLAPPLEHILRNSVAHGIETPDRRRTIGKAETGTVAVSFRQTAGRLVVEIIDDGAGLDSDRIRAKAIEKGLWDPERPMDEASAADMICTPGFSTAENVSQLAGRGVGMDAVREEVLKMGGRFAISNRPSGGLQVSMFLPLSVATVTAAAVEAAGEQFALPVEIVEHTQRLSDGDLQMARETGQVTLELDSGGLSMPYSDLSAWIGLSNPRPSSTVTLLVLREGDRRVALGADRLIGIADLPQRPLGNWWGSVRGVMGAVLLSNGRAAFLVDPLRMGQGASVETGQVLSLAHEPIVMVVDDSITVRKVAARFLERHGFRPLLARDGRQALELLVDQMPDAILMDVEMPRMDGFDCAQNIRENPKLSHIPIAMITSRTAEKHRRRASELGVDAYFGKPFREDDVLGWLNGKLLPNNPDDPDRS